MYENRMLRGIFGPMREVKREWRKLHNEKIFLDQIFVSSNQEEGDEWVM
jgi:hypothetical protein